MQQWFDCIRRFSIRERICTISKNEGKYVHPALHMCAPLQWQTTVEFPSDNMATVPQKMWAFNVVVYQEVPIRVGEKDWPEGPTAAALLLEADPWCFQSQLEW